MALFPCGVVYSTVSGQIRRWITPSSSGSIAAHPLAAGEAMYIFPTAINNTMAQAVAAITTILGHPPGDPRCAVVDQSNKVVAIINAEPSIDSVPSCTIISATNIAVDVGWTYDSVNKVFVAPVVPKP